jgi:hypothetical protein
LSERIAIFRATVSERLSEERSQKDQSSKLQERLASKKLRGEELNYYYLANIIRVRTEELIISS